PLESATADQTSGCSVLNTMSKRGARISSSSLVSDRFVSLPFRKSSLVRISQNCGVTASRGMAATSGNIHRIFFIGALRLDCQIERSLPLDHEFRLRKFVFSNR